MIYGSTSEGSFRIGAQREQQGVGGEGRSGACGQGEGGEGEEAKAERTRKEAFQKKQTKWAKQKGKGMREKDE